MNTAFATPEDYLNVIRNHKWLIILPIIVCLLGAWVLYLYLPKSYRSSTLLYFEEQKVRYVKGVDASGSEGPPERLEIIQSGITKMRQVLYRRELLLQVAEELHLYGYHKDDSSPAFEDGVVGRMRESVKIETPKETGFLKVSFVNESPHVARDVTARMAHLFVEEIAKSRMAIAESSSEFIQHELDKMKAELEAKERALAQFKASHVGSLPEQVEANLRAIDRLEAEATSQYEMEKTLNARLASVDKAIREYEDPESEASPKRRLRDPRLARIAELERNLRDLQAVYKETYPDLAIIRQEIKKLQNMTTEEYIGYTDKEDSESESDGRIVKKKAFDPYKAELLKQREDIQNDLQVLQLRKARITSDIKKYEQRIQNASLFQQELMVTQRDYENLHKSYQALLDKKLNVGMAGELEKKSQGTQLRIVDPASLPGLPEKPNVFFIMLGGLGLGCAVGFGSAFGLELLRRGYVSAEEVEASLGMPVIATISDYKLVWGGGRNVAKVSRNGRHNGRLALPDLDSFRSSSLSEGGEIAVGPEVVALWHPKSIVAEQYRVAATRIQLMAGKRKSTVVVVASSMVSEGKTCTALNLAHVLSGDCGKKTVLVDCDMKRPMVHALAGIQDGHGLADIFLRKKSLEECVEYHERLGFWILRAGNPHTANPLTHIESLGNLVDELRKKFEYILLDIPPMLAVAESHMLTQMADLVTYVIRARTTRRDVVQRAVKLIGDAGQLAVVLNGVDSQDMPYYSQDLYEPRRKQLR